MIDELKIAKLDLKPGDILVLKSSEPLTQEGLARVNDMFQAFKARAGIENECIVLDPSLSLEVVRRQQ